MGSMVAAAVAAFDPGWSADILDQMKGAVLTDGLGTRLLFPTETIDNHPLLVDGGPALDPAIGTLCPRS